MLALVVGYVVTFGFLSLVQFVNPKFAIWLPKHFPLVDGVLMVFTDCWWLLFAFLCSKTKVVSEFVREASLSQRLNLTSWFFAWEAIGIGLLANFGAMTGWSTPNPLDLDFLKAGGSAWMFSTIYGVSVTPFAEELVMRGFLYRAF
jgi:membrane protease YdiL (CAAX protease family)